MMLLPGRVLVLGLLTSLCLDEENDEKDQLELESTMNYLGEKLNVSLENAELFVVLELLQAPSVGEITREGYINGWKSSG